MKTLRTLKKGWEGKVVYVRKKFSSLTICTLRTIFITKQNQILNGLNIYVYETYTIV